MGDKMIDRRAMIGVGGLMGAAGAMPALAQTPAAAGATPWRPAMEEQDAWMDRPGTRHRLVLDTTTIDSGTAAMFYADNFYAQNKAGYGIGPEALGMIIVFRHFSTPFGFNDAMWAKYGATIADKMKMQGEQAIRAIKGNPNLSAPAPAKPTPAAKKGDDEPPVTLAVLAERGARFAVCGIATEGMAQQLARASGGDAKAINAELRANMIPGAVIVPAGIVAVNRAQERGYSFINIVD